MIHYAEVGPDDRVIQCIHAESADAVCAIEPSEGCTLHLLIEPIDWSGAASETTVLFWNDGVPEFRETLPLSAVIARNVKRIDILADIARATILAHPTNVEEYRLAKIDALAFQEAGFVGEAGEGVTTWTYAKRRQGWTDRMSAEDILTTAARWTAAVWMLRGHRLNVKELVRDSTTIYEAELLFEVYRDALNTSMQGLQ